MEPPDPGAPSVAGVPPDVQKFHLMRQAKRLVKIVFAFTIIVVAFALGFVPGIPGWPLALFGLSILAAEFVWAARLMKRVRGGATRLKEAALWRPKWFRKDSPPKA